MKVWYAAYASNLLKRRFMLYIAGGVLAETGRVHLGARDPSPPEDITPLWLPGTVYFATESTFWPGTGRALYDPDSPSGDPSAGRGYLITGEQLVDVLSQEMRLPPGTFDGAAIPRVPGVSLAFGGGHYETLVCTGMHDGHPVVTMSPPWNLGMVPIVKLAGPYREVIIEGLQETWGWDRDEAERYLATLPGGA